MENIPSGGIVSENGELLNIKSVNVFILSNYLRYTTEEIARQLGVSYQAVARRAKALGFQNKIRIPAGTVKKYSDQEEDFIKENMASMGYPSIAVVLGRTRESVKMKAKRMGLSVGKKILWSDEEDRILRENFHQKTYQELGSLIGKDSEAVRKYARSVGLSKRKPKT
jgi:hypothetical protein